jgi:hypothetical protein
MLRLSDCLTLIDLMLSALLVGEPDTIMLLGIAISCGGDAGAEGGR